MTASERIWWPKDRGADAGGSVTDDRDKGISDEQRERDRRLAWMIVAICSILTASLAFSLIWGARGAVSRWTPTLSPPRAPTEASREWPRAPTVLPANTARPIGDPAAWFGPDEYPVAALRNGDEGRVRVLLTIDPAGKPAECSLIEVSGHGSLDDGTCAVLMEVGRFDAAPNGQDRRRHWTSPPIRWALPRD